MQNTTRTRVDLLQILIAIPVSFTLLTINVIRIFNVPITIDENGYESYYSYKTLLLNTPGKANNHMLHSVIRKFFIELFSKNIFFYRVDSLIAQIVFLLFSYLLCRFLFKNRFWALLSFCMLNIISPFIFDFWGLSRGYALSLAFMMVSIYYLFTYLTNKRILHLSLSLVAAILAVYSNFGYISYFLSLCIVVVVQNIIFRNVVVKKRQIAKEISVVFIWVCVLAILITRPLINVYGNGEQYFLGHDGFIKDTVTSLVKDGLIIMPAYSILTNVIIWLVIAVTFSGGIYWLCIYFKRRYYREPAAMEVQFGITFYLLLVTPAVSMIAQHVFFQINYLIDRAALFFIILFVLHLVYLLYCLKSAIPKLSWGLFIIIFLLTSYNFCIRINLHSTFLWSFDADDLHVIDRIAAQMKDKPGKIKIRATWFFVPSFNYDIEQKYPGRFYPLSDIRDTAGKDTTYDYYYISQPEVTDLLTEKYTLDTSFAGGGFLLFKKKQ